MSLPPSASFAQVQAVAIAAKIEELAAGQRRRDALARRIDRAVIACEDANLAGVSEVPAEVVDLVVELQAASGLAIAPPATIAAALDALDQLSGVGEE